jgi:non-ribosomal peptide synthetase-like protein
VGRTATPPTIDRDDELSPAAYALTMIIAESALSLIKLLPLAAMTVAAAEVYGLSSDQIWNWMADPAASWTPVAVGLAMLVASVPLTLVLEVVLMRLLGRVRPGTISVRSLAYARVWLKTGILDTAGNWLSGTLFWPTWLRAAGMTIGARCEVSTIIDVVPELVTFGEDVFLADGIYLAGPRVQRGTVTLAATSLGDRTFLGNHVVIPAGQHLPNDVLLGVCTVADDRVVQPGTAWFGLPPFELRGAKWSRSIAPSRTSRPQFATGTDGSGKPCASRCQSHRHWC